MSTNGTVSRIAGSAFLFQFITSFSGGMFLKPSWFVQDDMAATMLKTAAAPVLLRANMFLDMLTALGVIFLGAMLFIILRKQNEKAALTAMGFYFLEAALLAASRMNAFSLLIYSREYALTGQPANLLYLGQAAVESMEFVGGTLHMLAFCPGAILFYFLLDKARLVPRWMSLWGLITMVPLFFGTLSQVFGHTIPFLFYIPYVPFELVIGLWILIKGIEELE